MKRAKRRMTGFAGMAGVLVALLLLGASSSWARAADKGAATWDQGIDPCDLMPPGGRISSQSDTSCVTQHSSTPAEKVVQIQTTVYGLVETERLCEGLRAPSDYHVFMREVAYGDCGIQAEIGYLGEPAPGYTGWEVMYYYDGIHVRIATSEDYPAFQSWIYDTAETIEDTIRTRLGTSEESEETADTEDSTASPETEDTAGAEDSTGPTDPEAELPDWVKRGEAYIDAYGEAIYVPGWLEWIKPPQGIKNIGYIDPKGADGEMWVYRRAFRRWDGPFRSRTSLYSGDLVATGPDTFARLNPLNDDWSHSVGPGTTMQISLDPEGERSEYPILWTLYEGAVKIKQALLRQAPVKVHPTIYMRTPTVVCGKREGYARFGLWQPSGSDPPSLVWAPADAVQLGRSRDLAAAEDGEEIEVEYVVSHDPDTQASRVYVLAGEIDYTNLAAAGPEDGMITAGQQLEVMENGEETISPIDAAELEALMASWDLEEIESVEGEETTLPPAEEPENTEVDDQGANRNRIIGLGLFILCSLTCLGTVLAVVVGIVLWRRRSAKRA